MIEAFLTKIVAAVLKKAAASSILTTIVSAIEIYSTVDLLIDTLDIIDSTNDCAELSVNAIQIISDPLSDYAVEQILNAGSHTISVEQSESGLYIVSRITPSFVVPSLSLPSSISTGGQGGFRAGNRGGFRSGGRGY